LEILATSKYTGDYFLEEIKGIADATGLDYKVRNETSGDGKIIFLKFTLFYFYFD